MFTLGGFWTRELFQLYKLLLCKFSAKSNVVEQWAKRDREQSKGVNYELPTRQQHTVSLDLSTQRPISVLIGIWLNSSGKFVDASSVETEIWLQKDSKNTGTVED